MNQNNGQDLSKLVRSLQGLRCWYVSGGGCTLPTFQIALGEKIARDVPLRNPAHPEEYRTHEGEANLLVWCSWRLDGPNRPVTSSDDLAEAITSGLKNLIGGQVESVDLSPPAWDLSVRFSNGFQLRVFCDHVPGDPSFDGNWELWLRETVIAAGPGDRLVVESRTEADAASLAPS